MIRSLALAATCWLLACPSLFSQPLDHYDVMLFSVDKDRDQVYLSSPRFLTAFNPRGYNNQPAFFSNQEIYLTLQTPDDISQTELYSLNTGSQQRERVTATPLFSEYSPALMPGGKRFSAVRVEEDGSQRLWSFPVDRSDNGRPEFYDIRGVGYYCWLRDTLCALFIVGENGAPHSLVVAGTGSQRSFPVVGNIGRSLQLMPNGKLAYVQKATGQTWFIKTWDPANGRSEILTQTLPGVEDFAVLPDGSFIAGTGSKLFRLKPSPGAAWQLVDDLMKYNIREITRLAVSPDGKRIAAVVR